MQRDTHCTHMQTHRCAGDRAQGRNTGLMAGGRGGMPQQCHSLPVNQAREALGWNSPKKNAQPDKTDISRAFQAGGLVLDALVGRVRGFIHSEMGKPIPDWRTTLGVPMGVLRVANAPPHPALASDTRRTIFGGLGCETRGARPFYHQLWDSVGETGPCRSKYTPCLPYTPGKHSQLLT